MSSTDTEMTEIAHPYTPPEGTLPLLAGVLAQLHFVHRDMVGMVRELPPEALAWTPGPEMSTLSGIVRHTMYCEKYCMLAAGGLDYTYDSDTDRQTLAATDDAPALVAAIVEADLIAKRALPALTVGEMHKGIAAWGGTDEVSAGALIADALNHTAMHWGHMQMTRQLWQQQHPEFTDDYKRW